MTWESNKNQLPSWKNAKSKLKKTIRGDRARQCSTGTVEANIHLMKRIYINKNKKKKQQQPKQTNNDETKEERYLSPPPPTSTKHKHRHKYNRHHNHHNNHNKYRRDKPKIKSTSSNLSQSSTSATDEESDNFPNNQSLNLNKKEIKPKKRKKSNHSSEPLNRNNYRQMVKYPNHEYRRRSRDDSELCNERLKLAAKSIERYIERKK